MSDLTTDMDPEDWQDVAESEFVDIVKSPISHSIGFVFEHPEIGLHGFQWKPQNNHLKAASFERQDDG